MNKRKSLSTIIVLTLLFSIFCSNTLAYASSFYDVADDFWAAPYIEDLASRGIISGYGDGYFQPDSNVQRCEYAKMLVNSANIPLSSKRTSPYADVDVNEWYLPFINSVTTVSVNSASSIMKGFESSTDGDERIYFKPEDYATRNVVTVALIKALGYDLSEYYPINDYLLSDVFTDYYTIPKQDRPYIAESVKRGYITGTQYGTFEGQDPITRCEVAAVLYRAFPNENLSYNDGFDSIDDSENTAIINNNNDNDEMPSEVALGISNIKVFYLNVGQGDSEFIEFPNGQTMLIDASTNEYGQAICGFISSIGHSKIDYLVATHPHADHIGGMNSVLSNFEIGTLYMPNVSTNTKTYENFLSLILEKNINVIETTPGYTILSDNGLSVDILAPLNTKYSGLNNYSAVIKIVYGNTSFLFMGDAESESEDEMLAQYSVSELNANVIKLGHHGSSTSSLPNFIQAVSPQTAVISCGADNKYGHPTEETLNTLSQFGITTYRTDMNGNVIIESDGNQLIYKTEF